MESSNNDIYYCFDTPNNHISLSNYSTTRFQSALEDLEQRSKECGQVESIIGKELEESEDENEYLEEFISKPCNLLNTEKEQFNYEYNKYTANEFEDDPMIELDKCNSELSITRSNKSKSSKDSHNNNNYYYCNDEEGHDMSHHKHNEYYIPMVHIERSEVIGNTKQKENNNKKNNNNNSKNKNDTNNKNNNILNENNDNNKNKSEKEKNQNKSHKQTYENNKSNSATSTSNSSSSENSPQHSFTNRTATPIAAASLKTSSVMQRTDVLLSPLYRFWSILWNYGEEHPSENIRGTRLSSRNELNNIKSKSDSKNQTKKQRTVMGSVVTGILRLSERFGRDAGKALSDQLKEPLDRLARSPITSTGEVIVVHTVDVESANVPKLMTVFGIFALALHIIKQYISLKFKKRQYRYLTKLTQ